MNSPYFSKTLTHPIGYKMVLKFDNFVAMKNCWKTVYAKLASLLLFSILFQIDTEGQSITTIIQIEPPAIETSGLLRIEEKTITHNDSGGEAALYEIDTLTGDISRTVEVLNATNIDWEAICNDETYLYIGDFGNNQGNRTDLKIYKILLSEYLDESNASVNSEVISFIYEDQDDFTPSQFTTNFDAEGFVVKNDVLIVFTKNWGNSWTNIYELPMTPGAYLAARIDSINTEGLVTDATYSIADDRVVLVGYTSILNPFVFEIDNIADQLFSESELTRTDIAFPPGFSRQVEGISHVIEENYILSTEEGITGNPGLFNLSMSEPNAISESTVAEISIYPNPSSGIVYVKSDKSIQFELLNLEGKVLIRSTSDQMDLKGLPAGTYLISIQNRKGVEIKREKIVVQ